MPENCLVVCKSPQYVGMGAELKDHSMWKLSYRCSGEEARRPDWKLRESSKGTVEGCIRVVAVEMERRK